MLRSVAINRTYSKGPSCPTTPEEQAAYNKQYYINNKEKLDAQNKKWADENRDKVNASHRGRYANNKEALAGSPVKSIVTRTLKKA